MSDERPDPGPPGFPQGSGTGGRGKPPTPQEIRRDAEADEEQRWTTEEMQRDFEPMGFAAPFVVVRRRIDGVKGTLEFTHSPRVYFGWREHESG